MIDTASIPDLLRNYLFYLETIKGRSPKTVSEYFLDLRNFLRYMNLYKNDQEITSESLRNTDISGLNETFFRSITLADIYSYLYYFMSSPEHQNNANTRSRKVSSIRGFFKYLTNNLKLLEENPALNLELPSVRKSMPKYLTLEQSLDLLNSVDGSMDSEFQERDYCILTLFLNCGMRLSELVGINLQDIRDNTLRLLGKGNKERIIYLNQTCMDAIADYLSVRSRQEKIVDKQALFISQRGTRISARRVQMIVEMYLKKSGLGGMGYSVHKLRHTAATLMYQYGQIDIRVLKDILGHVNLGTTEIYTHVSNTQMEHAADSNPLNRNRKPKKEKQKE